MGRSVTISLSLLSLGPKRKLSATMSILSMDTRFILKNMGKVEIYNSGVCVKRSTSSEFEVDYFRKLE